MALTADCTHKCYYPLDTEPLRPAGTQYRWETEQLEQRSSEASVVINFLNHRARYYILLPKKESFIKT